MVKVTSLLITAGSGLGFSFGAWTEMKIWCVKGMFMLKVVSHEKNLGFKGLNFNLTHYFGQQVIFDDQRTCVV